MTMKYASQINQPTRTPQSMPIPGQEDRMVRNDAGGYGFKTEKWAMLERFLTIGSEGGTYYVSQRKHTVRNAENVIACLAEDGQRVVDITVAMSESGNAATNDPALFVLALAMSPTYANKNTRYSAGVALPRVARTGSHLLTFVSEVNELRGWGKFLRRAVSAWYEDKEINELGYQVMKYRNRKGWSHRDVLRQAHPSGYDKGHADLYRYITHGIDALHLPLPKIVYGVEAVSRAKNEHDAAKIISAYGLTHEMVPNEWKKSPHVWSAILEKMPILAMIRNLGVMTACGLITPNSEAARHVSERLRNESLITSRRVHPIAILKAIKTYGVGHGFRGSLSWDTVRSVQDALQDAFYISFGGVEPTNKRMMLGIDVSGSMSWGAAAQVKSMGGMMCSEVAAAMMMVTFRTEHQAIALAFARDIKDLPVSRHDSLENVTNTTRGMSFGSTDCAALINHALASRIPVDAFVIYTDGDTWVGPNHPMEALRDYRQVTGIDSKLVVVNMLAADNSIADPLDTGTLDVVGFNAQFPTFLSNFVAS